MATLTIELPPQMEQKLREKASLSGQSLEAYLQALAVQAAQEDAEKAPTPTVKPAGDLSAEEWITQLRAWVARQPIRPVIADDSRESIYEGRGE